MTDVVRPMHWPPILSEIEQHALKFGMSLIEALERARSDLSTPRRLRLLAAAEASGDLARWLRAKGAAR